MKIYFAVAFGIAISVILPLVRAKLPKPPRHLEGAWTRENVWPYVATGIFSLIAAVLIVAAMGDQLDSCQKALIAGYAWDSTLQKITTGNVAVIKTRYQPARQREPADDDS